VSLSTSITARNAALDAQATLANTGYLRIYTGAKPATPETATSGTLLAELRLNATAFGAAAAGVITANAITADTAANDTGTAGTFRILSSDGTTALFDGTVTASGGGGDLTFSTVSFVAGAQISVTALTITAPQ